MKRPEPAFPTIWPLSYTTSPRRIVVFGNPVTSIPAYDEYFAFENSSSSAVARGEQLARRVAVGILIGVVDELLVADAALRFEPGGPLGLGNVSDDAVFLAGLERVAVVVAGIRKRGQLLDAEFFLGGCGHLVQLAGVVAIIEDLARHDELALVIDRDLHVVGRDRRPLRANQHCDHV